MSIQEEKNKFIYDLFKEKNAYFCKNFEAYIQNCSEESEQNLLNILKQNNGKFNLKNPNNDYTFFHYLDYFLQISNNSITIDLTSRLRNFFELYSQSNAKIEFSMKDLKTISAKNHIFLLPILFYRNSISYESFNEYCENKSYPLYISSLLHSKHKQALNGWLDLTDLLELPIKNKELKFKLFSLTKEEFSETIHNILDINCNNIIKRNEQISVLLHILDINKNKDYILENPSYYITLINKITQNLNQDKDYDMHEHYLNVLHNIYPLSFVVQDKDCRDYLEFLLNKYEKKYDLSYYLLQEFSEAKSNYEKGLLDNIIDNNIPVNKKNRI
ncbi:TPA: hypothetical protein NV714_000180 [Escherichia coli]|nr:hypothetical protein [Escherichia coli]